MKAVLRNVQQSRPAWDRELLLWAVFSHIEIDDSAWERIYQEVDEFYDPTPGFVLSAIA